MINEENYKKIKAKYESQRIVTNAWAEDFVKSMMEKNIFIRLLFRILVGKYTYREFIGLIESLKSEGVPLWIGYGLENCEYQKYKSPLDYKKLLYTEIKDKQEE